MCIVISLDAHRKTRKGIVKRQDFDDVYACGRCGNPTWIVTEDRQTRCAACNTRALNLKLADLTAPNPKTARARADATDMDS